MNPLTIQFLESIWEDAPTFKTIPKQIKKVCKSLSAVEAAYIGRDLLIRRYKLFTEEFKLAAYLASGGIAGNDSFLDFSDCAALLPDERYQKIITNHDNLIDDPISSEFDELDLISEVTNIFDNALVGEDNCHILYDLVFGDRREEVEKKITAEDAATLFPRLYGKFGHLMETSSHRGSIDGVTLSDMLVPEIPKDV